MTNADELRRVRWSVPRADVSVNRFLDAQYSISDSLRVLIREFIEREGYVDAANRPVEQQPRRGRPPLAARGVDRAGDEDDAEQTEQDEQTEDAQPNTLVMSKAAQGKRLATSEETAEDLEQTEDETDLEDAADKGSDEPRQQVSIDEVMASTRR